MNVKVWNGLSKRFIRYATDAAEQPVVAVEHCANGIDEIWRTVGNGFEDSYHLHGFGSNSIRLLRLVRSMDSSQSHRQNRIQCSSPSKLEQRYQEQVFQADSE